jgi:two-component system phosphate regulon sensor histidine kinase PhoR
MTFQPWRPWFQATFLELETWDYILLAVYALLTLVLLVRSRRDFRFTRSRLVLFIALLATTVLTNHLLALNFTGVSLLPPTDIPVKPAHPFALLLGALPIFAAGAWLGAGPAMLVGLVGGILRADTMISGIAEPVRFAFFGFLVGFLLRQDYRGTIPQLGRQPLVAAVVASSLSALLLLSAVAHVGSDPVGLDYALTLLEANFGLALLEGLVAASVLQAIYFFFPGAKPVQIARRSPPYGRSLSRRLVYLFALLTMTMTIVLVYAVASTTIDLAQAQAVSEITRDANHAVEWIPDFIQNGQSLLQEFADDERLQTSSNVDLENILGTKIRAGAFFDELMLADPEGRIIAVYPPTLARSIQLTSEEKMLLKRVIEDGAPQTSPAHRSDQGEVIISFLEPVEAAGGEGDAAQGDGAPVSVLIGRTRLDTNPTIGRILSSMQWTGGQGQGFVVDSSGLVIAHSNPDLVLTRWTVDENRVLVNTLPRGQVYESHDPLTNERLLVYRLRAEGYPWAVVIELPYEVVLEQAWHTAAPLFDLQIVFGLVTVGLIALTASRLTRPLGQLAAAADRIAEGELAQPVRVAGEDEVGRVGIAFEGMRVRLKDRVDDLSLLLAVGQAVSGTLDLSAGMPYILEGALRATGAQLARVVLLSTEGKPQMAISRGEHYEEVGALDQALAAAITSHTHPLIVENLARAKNLADPQVLAGPIKAVVALPMRTKGQLSGMIWVGYHAVQSLGNLETDVLSTLTSQAAMLTENAHLFQSAESGRRRLAAILHSTADAVLVTDRQDRVLLVNPAAEDAFGVAADAVTGQRVDQIKLPAPLLQALTESEAPGKARTEEIPLPNGRTLYANVSTILGPDDEKIGRVAVMRDITRLKELDEMKSEFLSTVSHDLRSPLMFMRGYANMLLTMSKLDDKQQEYVKKILYGVAQINDLVSDLLSLGRIETGVGLERKPCHLGVILTEAVDGIRAQAITKEITLRVETVDDPPIVIGDASLLRQAVSNLVDNAIKYTPGGGIVTVGLSVRDNGRGSQAVIRVADTGIGIATEDQTRLFEKFHRIKRRDTSDISGTGLGLAIVKSIVERHAGKVWVDSELHEGSTFYISLPLGETPEPSRKSERELDER